MLPQYRNLGIQRLGSGLEFKNENKGKGSRAKIARAVKHTCLSGYWNASVLGHVPGRTALLPREQLSATLLRPALLSGTFVRTMGNARPPAESHSPGTPHTFCT